MVHQPQRRFGDPHGPFMDLDATHGVHVDHGQVLDVEYPLAVGVQLLQNLDFQQTQFAVRHHQEIAAAAGRIQKMQLAQPLVEPLQLGLVAARATELGPQAVQQQRPDHSQNVAFRRVVPADLSALLRLHHGLEQRPEDGGRNPAPVEPRAGEQSVAHVPVELGEAQPFSEQIAVHVRQIGQQFVQIRLALFGGRIEHLEPPREMNPQIRTIRRRPILQVIREGMSLENPGVFGKQTEQHPNQEPLQGVPRIPARLERIVQIAQNLHGFDELPKFVRGQFGLGVFARHLFPLSGRGDSAVTDLVPG